MNIIPYIRRLTHEYKGFNFLLLLSVLTASLGGASKTCTIYNNIVHMVYNHTHHQIHNIVYDKQKQNNFRQL
jgi:hypothetical protein